MRDIIIGTEQNPSGITLKNKLSINDKRVKEAELSLKGPLLPSDGTLFTESVYQVSTYLSRLFSSF